MSTTKPLTPAIVCLSKTEKLILNRNPAADRVRVAADDVRRDSGSPGVRTLLLPGALLRLLLRRHCLLCRPGLRPGIGGGGRAHLRGLYGDLRFGARLPLRGKCCVQGLNPQPHTLNPAPYTLNPTPFTLHPTPCTLNPTPYTLHPTPSTQNRETKTLNPMTLPLEPDAGHVAGPAARVVQGCNPVNSLT